MFRLIEEPDITEENGMNITYRKAVSRDIRGMEKYYDMLKKSESK